MSDDEIRLLRIDDVCALVPVARSSIYRFVGQGLFPKPIKVGSTVMWRFLDIKAWIDSKMNEEPAPPKPRRRHEGLV